MKAEDHQKEVLNDIDNYLSNANYKDSINFWRKNTNRFKAIEQGSPFFFLVKNKKGIKKAGLITRKEILKELNEIYQIGLSDDAESFPEGKQALKKHLIRCANCHRMLHRKRPWLSLEELVKLKDKYEVK